MTDRTVFGESTNNGIVFHPDLLSIDPETRIRMNAKLDKMRDENWIPKNCTDPRAYIIKHECGHQVIGYIYKKEPELFNMIADIILTALRNGSLHAFCEHATSENIFEAFADIYASVYTVEPDFQPFFIRLIHRLLKQYKMPVKD